MQRTMMISKIHRATVTQSDLNYVGSITIDAALLELAEILPGQQVDVVNVTNGNRLTTYAIRGSAGSGVIGINGAAAHLVNIGDTVIIISYGLLDEKELKTYQPKIVFVDKNNQCLEQGNNPGIAPAGSGLLSSGE